MSTGSSKKRPADEPAKDWEKTLEPVRKLAAVLKAVPPCPPSLGRGTHALTGRSGVLRELRAAARVVRTLAWRQASVGSDVEVHWDVAFLAFCVQDPPEQKRPKDFGYHTLFEVRVPVACSRILRVPRAARAHARTDIHM